MSLITYHVHVTLVHTFYQSLTVSQTNVVLFTNNIRGYPLSSSSNIDSLVDLVKQKTQCSGRRHIVLFPFLPALDHSTANGKVSLQFLYGDE